MGYVRKLQKYMHVDIISNGGKCGGKDLCPKSRNEDVCYDMIEQTYKFYLAFENSICREVSDRRKFSISELLNSIKIIFFFSVRN